MEHHIELQHDQRLLAVTTSGEASFEAFGTLIGQLLKPPFVELNYDVIIDNRRLNLKSLTRQEAEALADLLAQHMVEVSHLKQALVAGDVLSYGISRLFELRASSIHNLPMRVFLSYEEALAWIRGDTQTEKKGDSRG
jgi:hypothetical protein